MKRNMAKLELYRKFTNSLAVSVLLSIAWVGFEVRIYFEEMYSLRAWIFPMLICVSAIYDQ